MVGKRKCWGVVGGREREECVGGGEREVWKEVGRGRWGVDREHLATTDSAP